MGHPTEPSTSSLRDDVTLCKTCKVPTIYDYVLNEVACPTCGVVDIPYFETTRSLSYEDERCRNFSSYSYKRSSHMSDWIGRMQGKCTHSIPTKLIDAVRAELKKHREPFDTVTPEKIRWVLRKIKQGVYYDQSSYIAFLISGHKHLHISEELETQLKIMFTAVEKEFQQHHLEFKRHNFLSYSFTLYKLLELLGEHDLQKSFSLLKQQEKLYNQDKIWAKLCANLKWPFIKTIA